MTTYLTIALIILCAALVTLALKALGEYLKAHCDKPHNRWKNTFWMNALRATRDIVITISTVLGTLVTWVIAAMAAGEERSHRYHYHYYY